MSLGIIVKRKSVELQSKRMMNTLANIQNHFSLVQQVNWSKAFTNRKIQSIIV